MSSKNFLVGFAIGDAVGVPVEFKPREVRKRMPVKTMLSYGTYNKPAGTWSDDTTMTIATMESIARRKTVDYSDIMLNYAKWYLKDEFTVDGRFDIGRTTAFAIRNFIDKIPALQCGGKDENTNGNGSLMRIMPIAIYLHSRYGNNFNDDAMEIIHNMSALTHAHPISLAGCGIYCLISAELLENKPIKEAVSDGLKKAEAYYTGKENFKTAFEKYYRLYDENFAALPEDKIESSGYVLHSLEAALWCFLNTNDYKSLILKAVNLGLDTDTIGAIAAGLGGLVYDVEDLPSDWLKTIRKREYLEEIEKNFLNSLND